MMSKGNVANSKRKVKLVQFWQSTKLREISKAFVEDKIDIYTLT